MRNQKAGDTSQVPQAIEIERAILGGMLLWDEVCELAAILSPEDFWSPQHQAIFKYIMDIYKQGGLANQEFVIQRLIDTGKADICGGKSYLLDLQHVGCNEHNAEEYIYVIREKSQHRKAISLTEQQLAHLYNLGDTPLHTIISKIQSVWAQECVGSTFGNDRSFLEIVQSAFGEIEDRKLQRAQQSYSTGYWHLDNVLGGILPGSLAIMGARPGDGKSCLLGNILAGQAIKHNKPVAIFSQEMRAEAMVVRIVSWQSQQQHRALRNGEADDWEKVTKIIGDIEKSPIRIDDSPALEIDELCMRVKRLVRKYNMQMIGVDFIQQVRVPKAKDRRLEVDTVVRSLQALARQTNVPIIALSQLSRDVELRDRSKPVLRDFLESSALETYADYVMAIWHPDGNNKEGNSYIRVLKNRHGEGGDVPIYWCPQHQEFRQCTQQQAEIAKNRLESFGKKQNQAINANWYEQQ